MRKEVNPDPKTAPFTSLALGTWTFAGDSIWSASSVNDSIRVIHAALDEGISLFDTSPNYGSGRSEEILGRALENRDAAIATKIKIDGKSPDDIYRAVEGSLRRLKRDVIDLMQIHWPSTAEETEMALDCFTSLKEEGKILNMGVCNFGCHDLIETEKYPLVSNQLPYSLLWRVVEEGIAPESKRRGMKVWAYSPFQQGLLSGKYRHIDDFPPGRMRTRHFSGEREAAGHNDKGMEAETQETLETFLKISAEEGIPALELALRYISSRSFIDTILVGARNTDQLKEIRMSMKGALPDEILKKLDRASAGLLKAAEGNPDMYQKDSRVRYR